MTGIHASKMGRCWKAGLPVLSLLLRCCLLKPVTGRSAAGVSYMLGPALLQLCLNPYDSPRGFLLVLLWLLRCCLL
jgi:hypothetical protein